MIPVFQKMESTKEIKKDDYVKILNIIYEILKLSDDTIEYEWLRREVDFEVFQELATPIFLRAFLGSKKNKEEDDLAKST